MLYYVIRLRDLLNFPHCQSVNLVRGVLGDSKGAHVAHRVYVHVCKYVCYYCVNLRVYEGYCIYLLLCYCQCIINPSINQRIIGYRTGKRQTFVLDICRYGHNRSFVCSDRQCAVDVADVVLRLAGARRTRQSSAPLYVGGV